MCSSAQTGIMGGNRQREDVSTAALVAAAKSSDQDAWRALVQRFSPRMWAVTRSFRLDQATRADLVQQAWLVLAEHLDAIRDPQAVGGWLAMTVRRLCLAEVGRLVRLDLRDSLVESDGIDPAPAPDELVGRNDRDARLWGAVRRLPERDQQMLAMITAEPPASYAEIALALGMPVGSIGPTRARCLARLREQLVAEGIQDLSAAG